VPISSGSTDAHLPVRREFSAAPAFPPGAPWWGETHAAARWCQPLAGRAELRGQKHDRRHREVEVGGLVDNDTALLPPSSSRLLRGRGGRARRPVRTTSSSR